MVIRSLNQVILPTFRWTRIWRMKIKYVCDLHKVISISDIQLLCSYRDEMKHLTFIRFSRRHNQVILPTFRWTRIWRMKIKYVCDLHKVISISDIQLLYSYRDEMKHLAFIRFSRRHFVFFLVYSQGSVLRTYRTVKHGI